MKGNPSAKGQNQKGPEAPMSQKVERKEGERGPIPTYAANVTPKDFVRGEKMCGHFESAKKPY